MIDGIIGPIYLFIINCLDLDRLNCPIKIDVCLTLNLVLVSTGGNVLNAVL